MSKEKKSSQIPFFTGEPFERMVAILIALVTLLAAVTALLEANAAEQVSQALRRAQQYSMQAIGTKASGEMQAAYAWTDAYRHWLEWETRALEAERNGDPMAADRYRAVRDRASELTPLLSADYFDPAVDDFPNLRAFESGTYLVETTILRERFINEMELSGELEDKEKAHGTQLLMLAVSLFLFGLSVTIVGRMQWLFVGTATLIANITLVWSVVTYMTVVTIFPVAAIEAYARGVGFAHQDDYVAAIESFEQATEQAPGFANAYYARANAYFEQGELVRAATDYAAAIEAGREDVNVFWNLGWTYYVLGHSEEAIETTQVALGINSEQVALHFNLGLAYLAQGNLEAAQAAYTEGTQLATQQVADAKAAGEDPPASLWWYLSTAATDLDNLITCFSTQLCHEAPPYDAIPVSDDLKAEAVKLRTTLKNLTVGLEYLGHPPGEEVAANISTVQFGTPVYDEANSLIGFTSLQEQGSQLRFGRVNEDEGEQLDTNIIRADPDQANQVFILFNYAEMADGQLLAMKVYKEGLESPGLRLVEEWTLGQTGEAVLPLTPGIQFALAPGEYRVEIYVDSHLIQEGVFTIDQG